MRILIILFLIVSCGKSSGDNSCTEKAEISQLALSYNAYSTGDATISANITIKDECPNVNYSAIYALKANSAPKDCNDGDNKIGGSSESWTNAKASTIYFVRSCVTTGSYVSAGVVKSITTTP